MKRQKHAIQALAALTLTAAPALAEPVVVHVPSDQDQGFILGFLDPSLPDIRIRLDGYTTPDLGGGAAPLIIDTFLTCQNPQPVTYETQAADLSIINGTSYTTPPGLLIEDAIGSWIFTRPTCDFSTRLPHLYSYSNFCGCQNESATTPPDGQTLGYIPFRMRTVGAEDWTYGWVAFRTETESFTCETDCGNIPSSNATFAYVAVGIESEPNTPILAGGGLCPGDINFDAQRDIFDVFDYLDLYASMDPAADLTDDGSFDIFDVFAFLDAYETPCDL